MGKSQQLRKRLRRITGANAVLAWVVSGLWVTIAEAQTQKSLVKAGIVCVSILQIALIILSSSLQQQWFESVRQALALKSAPVLPLRRSPIALRDCILECCVHLLLPLPGVAVQWKLQSLGSYTLLSLDDCCCMLLLLRNYHFLRYLFWHCPLSSNRSKLFTEVAGLRINLSYVVRYCLAIYSLLLLSLLYCVFLLTSGLSLYLFERYTPNSLFDSVENGLWLVGQTQSNIGYGELTPRTYPGCLVIITSCLIGNFILSILVGFLARIMSLSAAESTLYSEIAYEREKRKSELLAVNLVQSWWKLMSMRLHHRLEARVILSFYQQQGLFKAVLTSCKLVKDNRFEGQIESFHASATRELRHLTEYLQPILYAGSLVRFTQTTDLLRVHYNTLHKLHQFNRLWKRGRGPVPQLYPRSRHLSGNSSASAKSEKAEMMRAKAKAHQKLIGRLLKEIPDVSS